MITENRFAEDAAATQLARKLEHRHRAGIECDEAVTIGSDRHKVRELSGGLSCAAEGGQLVALRVELTDDIVSVVEHVDIPRLVHRQVPRGREPYVSAYRE